MCGINGYINDQYDKNINKKIQCMNDKIIHRGPDDDGSFININDKYSIGLGMRRLSIIDLSSGSQPIFSKDKSVVIVFNGEIYNYSELKNTLIKDGVTFKTTSDTEVILEMYLKYGVSSFSKLDGMYSFAIYDKNNDKVFIARDFFGEKPLYYYNRNNRLIWASELKSILNVIDEKLKISNESLSLFFQLTYIPAPFTIFDNIHKLEPYHYIVYNCNKSKIEIKKINDDINVSKYKNISFNEAKNTTRDLIRRSVKSRSVSDVPIGTFLSGGVDSSIVSFCLSESSLKKIDTFSIGFDKKSFDETDRSREVAKLINSNHHEFRISHNDIKQYINEIILNFDEPFADSSALPTFLVSKFTSNEVKVALTGDGGDEVFGGYNKYYIGRLNNYYTTFMPEIFHQKFKSIFNKSNLIREDNRGFIFKVNRLLNSINYSNDFYFNIISLGFQKDELEDLFVKDKLDKKSLNYYKKEKNNSLNDFRNIDKNISLEGDMLVKVDRTSMMNSLECRAPFLNKEIWNFTHSIPSHFLIKGWNKKYILKESFSEYFPDNFLNKSKKGFGVPVGDWLRINMRYELCSYIDSDFIKKQNIFNLNYVKNLVDDHLNQRKDSTFKVWTYYCFQKWYKNIYEEL